jgi:hypothetical protein
MTKQMFSSVLFVIFHPWLYRLDIRTLSNKTQVWLLQTCPPTATGASWCFGSCPARHPSKSDGRASRTASWRCALLHTPCLFTPTSASLAPSSTTSSSSCRLTGKDCCMVRASLQAFVLNGWASQTSIDFAMWSADVTHILSDLELIIHRVKVCTTPDGKVVDLFFITDGM